MKKPNKKTAARTAAMKPANESEKLLGIAARIMKLSADAEPEGSWREKVKRTLSGCENQDEGMIRAGQAMRDAAIDVDFANMTICCGAEDIAADRVKTDAELAKISRTIDAAEKAHGLGKDEYWPQGEAPDDVETLRAAYTKRSRQIEADVLREFGENEMADALLADEDAFNAKYREPGRAAHFGPLPTELAAAKETKHEQN